MYMLKNTQKQIKVQIKDLAEQETPVVHKLKAEELALGNFSKRIS